MKEILRVENIKKYFSKKNWYGKQLSIVRAVDDVSFSLDEGDVFVLAGESGSGKSTIAKIILQAIPRDGGRIVFDGTEIDGRKESVKKIRMQCQMVYQDPYDSINPQMKIKDIIAEPLEIYQKTNHVEKMESVKEVLREVRLEPVDEVIEKYPHELSGGQRQRVVLARALVLKPKLIIADEPVSMLDVSIRAEILELMENLRQKYHISFIYITHDLTTARYFGKTLAILYMGKIVEIGPINSVISNPRHPYTQALLDAILEPDPKNLYSVKKIRISEPTQVNVYEGCRFRSKCPYAFDKCSIEPPLEKIDDNRSVACFAKLE